VHKLQNDPMSDIAKVLFLEDTLGIPLVTKGFKDRNMVGFSVK